jgi:hypothetical protein
MSDFDFDFDRNADTRRGFQKARPTLWIPFGPWLHSKSKSKSQPHLPHSPT